MDASSYDIDNFKDYHWLKDSYLSDSFENNQLLVFLMNVMMLIIFFMERDILFNVIECLIYLVSQLPLADIHSYPLYLD